MEHLRESSFSILVYPIIFFSGLVIKIHVGDKLRRKFVYIHNSYFMNCNEILFFTISVICFNVGIHYYFTIVYFLHWRNSSNACECTFFCCLNVLESEPPENCHLNVKKNWQFFWKKWIFLSIKKKKVNFFGNFLTF